MFLGGKQVTSDGDDCPDCRSHASASGGEINEDGNAIIWERERERERERADMYQSLDQSFRQHHQSAQHGRQKYAALHQAADSLHITTAQ